ncbi:hypothetical protein V6N12_031683 [Hibiscus sabdariffa]|uniref:Uncharacterized protein n=1 Tax=Hibiscus sabdariffa TaxID=183260 RepID=A0ABR2DV82_9ROSI
MSVENPCLPIKEVQQPVEDNEIRRTPYMLCGKPQPRSSNLDVHIVSDALIPLVKASPRVSVPVCKAAIKSQFTYTVNYDKPWYPSNRAIQTLYGQWEQSYNDLRPWLKVMQKYNPGTVVELETVHVYENDQVVPGASQFHRLFWTFLLGHDTHKQGASE